MKDIRGAVRRPRAMVYNNEMNPNNILLYLQIGVLFNHDLSGFLLQQIRKNTKIQGRSTHRERNLGIHNSKKNVSIKSLPLELRECLGRRE